MIEFDPALAGTRWDEARGEWVGPAQIAARIIGEYVADSYECLAQIDMAKRRLAEVKEQVSVALGSVADELTDKERRDLFAAFYWDAVELPSEPVLLGFGCRSLRQWKVPGVSTGMPCGGCGRDLIAKSRTEARAPGRYCKDCEKLARKADFKAWQQQEDLVKKARDEHLAELRSMRYGAYLRTPEWQATRAAALKRARYACQLCKANQWVTLDVHHNTYERRGDELPADLIVLCRDCHKKHHSQLPDMDATPEAQS